MIGFVGKDSAFFTVKAKDIPGINQNLMQQDLISFSITEEMDRLTTGSIQLRDPADTYSQMLRTGVRLELSWGYKANFTSIGLLGIGGFGDLFAKGMDRRGLMGIIQNPSGGGSGSGEKHYNASFIAGDWSGLAEPKLWGGITRRALISIVMTKLGVVAQDIRFPTADQTIPIGNEVRQMEGDFRFLVRLAREWRTHFRIGYSPIGVLTGIFLDNDSLVNSKVAESMAGAGITLNYNAGSKSNILEYSWQNSEGENGAGDNATIEFVNGEPVIRRFTVENETVRTWQLNPAKVKAKGDELEASGTYVQFLGALALETDFEKVKHYFDPIDQTTAPNGLGYTVNARMIGNPFASPPALVKFGEGFPAPLTQTMVRVGVANRYYLRKATHTISRSGYFTEIEVADVYLLNPAGGGWLL